MNIPTISPEMITKSTLDIKSIIAPDPVAIYEKRVARIIKMKDASSIPEYMALLLLIAKAQLSLAKNADFDMQPQFINDNKVPFAIEHCKNDVAWQTILMELMGKLLPQVDSHIASILRQLLAKDKSILQEYMLHLRQGELSKVPAEYSLFIWSALAVYWSHWAPLIIPQLTMQAMENRQLCPVCGSHPVASMIKDAPRKGLRYQHCSLCETEWHMVRASCTNCFEADKIFLWAEQEKEESIRIESCEHCHGYSKMLFTNIEPNLDAVVDDLLTMHFDQYLAEEGFKSTTINPYLLVHEQG